MATEFLMPKLGLTMEEGTILQWLVDDGDEVAPGMAVMVIETDKVESEVEASGNGRLHRLGAVGDTFPCGSVVGLLLADGESSPAAAAPTAPAAVAVAVASPVAGAAPVAHPGVTSTNGRTGAVVDAGGRRFVSPNARRLANERGIDLADVRGTGPDGRIVSEDLDGVAPRAPAGSRAPAATTSASLPASGQATARRPVAGSGGHPSTVAARQLADLLGIDLAAVDPDPVDGYITREAVARHVRARLQPAATPAPAAVAVAAPGAVAGPAPVAAAAAPSQEPSATRRLTGMRGTIAKRMHASLHEMAQLTLTMDADVDAVVADRERRRAAGPAPSYTDYVIAATARALRSHPAANAQVVGDVIAQLPAIHVGFAVALDDGLLVPVVRDADRLTLDELAPVTTQLAAAARSGKLGLDDLEGGTFSVSALGMFGVDAFTPVVNPPNAAILGVGRLRDDLAMLDGHVVVRKRMTLSLTWDHRVLDGAPAAAFCRTIVEHLAAPATLS